MSECYEYAGTKDWSLSFREQISTGAVCELCQVLDDNGCEYTLSIEEYGLTVTATLTAEEMKHIHDEYDWAICAEYDTEQ